MEKICRSATATNSTSSSSATATTSEAAVNSFSSDNSNSSNIGRAPSGTNNSSNYIANSYRVLNKSSYKISKPICKNPNPSPNLIRPPPPPSSGISSVCGSTGPQQQQSQPPVYNIDKNDFRDVVQKLTGSPAHLSNRPSPPPPPPPAVMATSPPQQQPRASAAPQPLSRLHRIRPPPLAQLLPHHPPPIPAAPPLVGDGWVRPPLSPLPPFPTVSMAAESPISAYMRRLHSGQPLLAPLPPGVAQPQLLPLSPLSFGCAPSPQTAAYYQLMLAPSLHFPTSPGMPIPSPK
ncbi:hypothetical protein KFK09_025458 [Dendrobium nobile]|uniref:VQ domain-containing protein n=1 Tax=Dendrobium nobile TaxID=94219 RepID=A0A8T3AGN0_DENNO|nr:hypothetical protein KFK09_025458 [Dendrobium nobile]